MSNGRDHGVSEMNHHQPHQSGLHPRQVMCIWWDWKGVLYYEFLLENQKFNTLKYCSLLDQLKAASDENHSELVNRKCKIFHQENMTACFFNDQSKSVTVWLGSSDSLPVFIRHFTL